MKPATASSNEYVSRRSALAAFLFAFSALGLGAQTAPGRGAPRPAVKRPMPPLREEQAQNKADDATHQGITVHGQWTITIKNPDGSTAEKRQFQNSLNAITGSQILTYLISGQLVAGGMDVNLNSGGQPPCPGLNGCYLYTGPASNYYYCLNSSDGTCYPNLTIAVGVDPISSKASLTLSGSIPATQTGNITYVNTDLVGCNADQEGAPPTGAITSASPYVCSTNPHGFADPYPLTQTQVSAISVTSGQTIQVTVVITFS